VLAPSFEFIDFGHDERSCGYGCQQGSKGNDLEFHRVLRVRMALLDDQLRREVPITRGQRFTPAFM